MNVYLWTRINSVSWNYHCEGGLVVVADNEECARGLIDNYNLAFRKEHEHGGDVIRFHPSYSSGEQEQEFDDFISYPLQGEHEPAVFVFPDAGCC